MGLMHLRVKCVNKDCADYDVEKMIDVGRLQGLLSDDGSSVSCPVCHSLTRIIVPFSDSQGGTKPPGPRTQKAR